MKKIMLLTTAAVLALGVTSLAYAKEKDSQVVVNKPFKTEISKVVSQDRNEINNDMVDIMKKNGYENIANEVEKGNYKAMDDFMNNITEEDFQKMIDIIKKSGNENMANMMESIGREGMIEMHNSMGGAEACHGSNGNTNENRSTNNNVAPNGMMNRSL
ncbi:hypothetical protein JOC70_000617 [Clostridium pascui]|uniref:hypothetical protein n=1 Tax=Clostridium pascui TaxID=46609 RepID=UPI00195667E9|nr:hypothetical protein [Clostridium pascui]MBM7869148.1 hypothetical protein [Clostridium pascui]